LPPFSSKPSTRSCPIGTPNDATFVVGGVITGILFTIGKSLIGWYIASSAVASSYGAAGALIILLLWVYYSVQIFLFGAEFTKIYANRLGSKQAEPAEEAEIADRARTKCS